MVMIGATPSTPQIRSNSPVCAGSNLELTSTPLSGEVTYVWVLSDGRERETTVPSLNLPNEEMSSGVISLYARSSTGCVSGISSTVVEVRAGVGDFVASATKANLCAGETLQLNAGTLVGARYEWSGPNGYRTTEQNPSRVNIQPMDAGTYNVVAIIGGCTSTVQTVMVSVDALPVVTGVTNNGPVCVGSELRLYATAGANVGYEWSGPGGWSSEAPSPVIANAQSGANGVYSLVVVSAQGCRSRVMTTSAIVRTCATCNAPDRVTVGTVRSTTAQINWTAAGGSVSCYVISYGIQGTDPNTWATMLIPAPMQSATLTDLRANTMYGVRVRSNCTNCHATTGTLSSWTAISNVSTTAPREGVIGEEAMASVSLYPNPNNGQFVLAIGNVSGAVSMMDLRLQDNTGKVVWTGRLPISTYQSTYEVSVSDVSSGLYLLEVTLGDHRERIKVMIK